MNPLPRSVYFKDGFVLFRREGDKIHYKVWRYATPSMLICMEDAELVEKLTKQEWMHYCEVELGQDEEVQETIKENVKLVI